MTTFAWHDEPVVFVIDRDPRFCQTLRTTVKRLGLRAEYYGSVEEFCQAVEAERPGCLVIDLQGARWGLNALFERLGREGIYLPVVVVSAAPEVPAVVEAIRTGALNYLEKTCGEARLVAALQEALAWDAQHRRELLDVVRFQRRLSRLTAAEREVLDLVVGGMSNREVAAALGRSERAIEARRAKIRKKLKARGLADLVRQTEALRRSAPLGPPRPSP